MTHNRDEPTGTADPPMPEGGDEPTAKSPATDVPATKSSSAPTDIPGTTTTERPGEPTTEPAVTGATATKTGSGPTRIPGTATAGGGEPITDTRTAGATGSSIGNESVAGARPAGAVDAVTKVFGIRHHGPGSARSLRLALAEFQPDAILIEGPADADPLVGYVAAEGMVPPVALLAYVPDYPARAAFWPFALFSPEWQALRYGAEHDVPVRFCDLPATVVLAAGDEPGDSVDPLSELAAAGGYDDAERWWDAVVESTADATAFDAITEAMAALREPAESGTDKPRPYRVRPALPATDPPNRVPAAEQRDHIDDSAPETHHERRTLPPKDMSDRGEQAHAPAAELPERREHVDHSAPEGHHTRAAEPTEHGAGGRGPRRERHAPRPKDMSDGGEPARDPAVEVSERRGPSTAGVDRTEAVGPADSCSADSTGQDDTDGIHSPASESPTQRALTVDAHTLRREAYMRQTMRKALKDGARRLAVVCGAWHAPALVGKLGPAAADARLLKGLSKVKVRVTWVPWTHSRLSTASGYGAGIDSPGWYQHLFSETEQPIVRWLTKVAGVLRAHDLPVSSAHVIEGVRLANAMATLRGRPLAGLSEVTEAVRAVLCAGEETMVQLVIRELVVGEALGAVPADTPTVPLDADLRARIRRLRLKQEPTARVLDLDLRKEREVERSRLLHRLRVLDIDWGTPAESEVRSTGTFRETWTLKWRPEYAVAIIEASRWGTTIALAAETKILDLANRQRSSVSDLTAALEVALLAELGGATDGLIQRLESAAALDHDVTHLLAALPGLTQTLRYGDVRGTDTKALEHVVDGFLVRICAGLPSAVTGLDTEAAEQLRDLLDAAHIAIHTRDNATATAEWRAALARLADRDDVHGALVGRAVRLLADAGLINSAEAARRLSAALSVGSTPAAKAAWIDGFLGGRGLLLVHDRELLRLINTWLADLGEDQFVQTLPLLRRTFGAFESGERRAIGHAVRTDRTGQPKPDDTSATDIARGTIAMRTAATVLGVAP